MASLGSLVIELAANSARLQGDLGKAVGMAERAAGKFKSVFGGLVAAGGGLGLASLAGQAISLGDELQKGAQRARIGAAEFSKLAAGVKQADVGIDTLSRGLKEMQKTISEANSGSKSAADSLDAIGLSAERLRQLSPTEQLEAIADGLNAIVDPTDHSRRGAEILGKAYLDLVPALEGGAAGLRALVAEQEKLGNTFSDKQVQDLADTDDAIKKLKASWSGFATTLIASVAPALTTVFGLMTPGIQNANIDSLRSQLASIENGYDEVAKAALRAQIAQAEGDARQRRLQAVSRGSGYAGQVIEESRRAKEAAEEAAKAVENAAKKRAEADRKAEEARIKASADAWDHMNVSLQTRAEGLLDGFAIPKDVSDSLLESTSGIADEMSEIFKQPFDELSPYAEQAARNTQDAFADFLFDPFNRDAKGMLKGFIDVIRRMVAEAAAAKIFGSKESGGLGLGGLVTGALGALFGGATAGATAGGGNLDLRGFATGGSFDVGGSGGTDSQLVAFKATPGERVSVRTPGQSAGGVVNIYQTVDARGATMDAIKMLPAAMKAASDDAVSRIQQQRKAGRL